MVQPNVKPENSLKQPVACKANPCKKQVLGVKFAKFFRKHIKIFSFLIPYGTEFYVSFPYIHCFFFSPKSHKCTEFCDLVPPALCPHNINVVKGRVLICHLQAVRIIKGFHNLNEVPSHSPLLEAQQAQLPQPFLPGVIFQTPD